MLLFTCIFQNILTDLQKNKIQKRITPMQGCQFFVIFKHGLTPMPNDVTLSGLLDRFWIFYQTMTHQHLCVFASLREKVEKVEKNGSKSFNLEPFHKKGYSKCL